METTGDSGGFACCVCGASIAIILLAVFGLILLPRRRRRSAIMKHKDEWGEEVCQLLLKKRIGIGMTEEMVRLSWGKPSKIETKEITAASVKKRWVYGQPRKGANYVHFKDGRVTKIQQ